MSTLPAPMVNPWRTIDMGPGFEDGINFHNRFHFNATSVSQALERLQFTLQAEGNPCYCLHHRVDSENHGYFAQLGDAVVPGRNGAHPQMPEMIPLQRLVPDYWTWAPLAIRIGPPHAAYDEENYLPETREFLRDISWQVMIRLQAGKEYIGYFKLVGRDGSPAPRDRVVRAAAWSAKFDVESLIAYRRAWSPATSKEFRSRILSTADAMARTRPEHFRRALRHVADLLTSHLGACWNRAAFYALIGESQDTLRCLWAQGGDGRHDWCDHVQKPLAERVQLVEDIIHTVRHQDDLTDDPYLRAAAGHRPVEVYDVSNPANKNLLAQLWRAEGDVGKLPRDNQRWEINIVPAPHMTDANVRRMTSGGPIAAMLYQDDYWVRQTEQDRPGEPIFISKNLQYFLVPWMTGRQLIGIWVLDNAYWSLLEGQPDRPSLALTKAILTSLSPAMGQHLMNHWKFGPL